MRLSIHGRYTEREMVCVERAPKFECFVHIALSISDIFSNAPNMQVK